MAIIKDEPKDPITYSNSFKIKCTFSGLRQFLATERSLQIMKMLFIPSLKLFSFSKYLNFCLDFLVKQKNGLIRIRRLTSKFMTSQPEKKHFQYTYDISRSKENRAMKFGHLIEYNMRNIFLKKSCSKCSGETIPIISRPFCKKLKSRISLDQQSNVLNILFLLYAKLSTIKIY